MKRRRVLIFLAIFIFVTSTLACGLLAGDDPTLEGGTSLTHIEYMVYSACTGFCSLRLMVLGTVLVLQVCAEAEKLLGKKRLASAPSCLIKQPSVPLT